VRKKRSSYVLLGESRHLRPGPAFSQLDRLLLIGPSADGVPCYAYWPTQAYGGPAVF